MRKITVGTRRSALAKTQTLQVVDALIAANPGLVVEVMEVVTKGDRIQDRALAEVGGKGLFVSEIEALLQEKTIDFAVHSMKDVPAELADGLTIGAVPKREDARDLLISVNGYRLNTLPEGARIGTSSLRRSAMLLFARRDLKVEPLRGNIDTRLRKLASLDAIILAAAGLSRMGWWQGETVSTGENTYVAVPLPPSEFIPAVGQGALALECREDDEEVLSVLGALHDPLTFVATNAERAFLGAVGGSCQVPVAAHALASKELGDEIHLMVEGFIGMPDGTLMVRDQVSGLASAKLGQDLALHMLENGGRDILSRLASTQSGWK